MAYRFQSSDFPDHHFPCLEALLDDPRLLSGEKEALGFLLYRDLVMRQHRAKLAEIATQDDNTMLFRPFLLGD